MIANNEHYISLPLNLSYYLLVFNIRECWGSADLLYAANPSWMIPWNFCFLFLLHCLASTMYCLVFAVEFFLPCKIPTGQCVSCDFILSCWQHPLFVIYPVIVKDQCYSTFFKGSWPDHINFLSLYSMKIEILVSEASSYFSDYCN